MKDETVKAYAKAYGVVEKALERKGHPLTVYDRDKCIDRPFDGFTPCYQKAVRFNALTETDENLIGLFLSEVDPMDDLHSTHPIPVPQQGVWELAYMHWRDLYTPAKAAEILGITKQRVGALIKSKQLDSIKIGGRYLIPGYTITRRKNSREDAQN